MLSVGAVAVLAFLAFAVNAEFLICRYFDKTDNHSISQTTLAGAWAEDQKRVDIRTGLGCTICEGKQN